MDTVPSERSQSDNSQPILHEINGHLVYGVPAPHGCIIVCGDECLTAPHVCEVCGQAWTCLV